MIKVPLLLILLIVRVFDVYTTHRRALKYGGIEVVELSSLVKTLCGWFGLTQGLICASLIPQVILGVSLAYLGWTSILAFIVGIYFGWFTVQLASTLLEDEIDSALANQKEDKKDV